MSKNDRDELIISALITAPTIRAAADSLEMSESQLYERLKEREFREKYTEAKTAILKAAEAEILTKLSEAIGGIWNIATKQYQTDALRLKAYEMIISSAVKVSEAAHKAERDRISDSKEDKESEEFEANFGFADMVE